MNSENKDADRVWERTLPQIRRTKIHRRNRKLGLAASAVCGLFGCWLSLQNPSVPRHSVVVDASIPELPQKIAVMRIDGNGQVRLEELAVSELGSIELAFSLNQIVSDELPN